MSTVVREACTRSAKNRSFVVLVTALVAFLLAAANTTRAQMHLAKQHSEDQVTVGLPGKHEPFCSGNACPGQTCDALNEQCVGDVTLQPAMGRPLNGLSAEQLERFEVGRLDFDRDISAVEGLGPIFNQTACGSCHITPLGGAGTITVNRFGILDFDTLEFDPLAELGGSLQQSQSISAECAENLPFPPANTFAQRLTNSTLGFGLVEAIPDGDILFNELNPPSPNVSGRARIVGVLEDPGAQRVGRFGWKAQVATVLTFSSDAALNEMGLTNRFLPNENAPNGDQALLANCDTVADPEDFPDQFGREFIDRVTDFQRFLAQPPQTPRSGMAGEQLFNQIGCADCHIASFTTGTDDEDDDLFVSRTIKPYSDFLVHDMGFAADFIGDGPVSALELRTPPLWGMRLRDPLWHDGRVAGGDLTFRVMFPGGIIDQHNSDFSEARPSAQAFLALTSAQKNQVVAFLDSLGRREFDIDGDGDVDDTDRADAVACAASGAIFTPDDVCAIADANQDGDVDATDLALMDVAMGVDDEDEDGDEGDDESSQLVEELIPDNSIADGANMDITASESSTANGTQAAGAEPSREERQDARPCVEPAHASRTLSRNELESR